MTISLLIKLFLYLNRKDVHTSFNYLLVSFLFVFQNDNDLIDNDNAGQSPAAQAVVLTFTLTYYLILTLFRFSFGCFDLCLNSYHICPFFYKIHTAKVSPVYLSIFTLIFLQKYFIIIQTKKRIFCSI